MLPVPRRNRGGELTRYGEHPLESFRRQFDALFDQFFGGALAPFGEEGFGRPHWGLDVQDRDREVVVRAEVPGFDEKDLDVQLNNDELTIRAEKQQKGDGQERYSRYYRTVTLPPGIDAEKAQATYHNGVLELHLPRTEQGRGKRIPIQARQGQPSGGAEQAKGQAGTSGAREQAKTQPGASGAQKEKAKS
jgi:HSP20 family protein